MSTASERARKDANARIRAAFEGESTHIRAGSWQGLDGAEVTVVGQLHVLHGTVCTCCKRRTTEAGAA